MTQCITISRLPRWYVRNEWCGGAGGLPPLLPAGSSRSACVTTANELTCIERSSPESCAAVVRAHLEVDSQRIPSARDVAEAATAQHRCWIVGTELIGFLFVLFTFGYRAQRMPLSILLAV